MLKLRNLVLLLTLAVFGLACKKDKYDPAKQLVIDEEIIRNFIAAENLQMQRHESGIYYQIIAPGVGDVVYSPNTRVSCNYEGRLLNGSVFDKSKANTPVGFNLNQVIEGWGIAIPLIQKGGIIRMIIPSVYAYKNTSPGSGVPKDAVLDFTVELVNVQ